MESNFMDRERDDVIDAEMARVMRSKSERERLQIAWGMWRSARSMIERLIAAEYPQLSLSERQAILAQRLQHGA